MSGSGEVINWYAYALHLFHGSQQWWPVIGSLTVVGSVVILGFICGFYRLQPEKLSDEELLPSAQFGFKTFFELLWDIVTSAVEGALGEHSSKFMAFLGSLFLFIVITNLSGLLPGFTAATSDINLNLAMALCVFVMFNYVGFKYAGMNYLKHFAGPVLALAPLIFMIEILGVFVRPISLSVRLTGNMAGEHVVYGSFAQLLEMFHVSWLPVLWPLMVFSAFVCILQAYIFVILSSVYVRLSLDTAHHDH